MNDYKTTVHNKIANKILYFGEVVSIDDPFESRTIKVRIPDFDTRVENDSLPPCYPAFPMFFHFLPKVGERVIVLMDRVYNADKQLNQEKRYYLAVTISQFQRIENDPYHYTAASNEDDGWTGRETPISEIAEARGTYPKKDEIAILGRQNTDAIFKEGEVLLRAGKHEKENVTQFNRQNPAYIQIRYGINNASKEKKTRTVTQVENIPPTHAIKVTTDAQNRLLIRVFRLSDNFIEENFSASYDSRQGLITSAKVEIKNFQVEYPRWQLRTIEDELDALPILFPNNQRIVKREVEITDQNEFNEFAGSVINAVAEKINLISHKNIRNYNLTDPDQMIDEDIQLEINSTAQPIVFGDSLVELLRLFTQYVQTHVHPYHGLPVAKDEIVQKILNFNLDSILNKNIRTA